MAKVGEVMICSEETGGRLESLEYFNGHTIECIGGGYNKMFIVEASGQVSALHPEQHEDEPDAPSGKHVEVRALTSLGPLADIRCGKFQNLFLTKDGFVYSYGEGSHGALGHGNYQPLETPQIIQALSDKFVAKVACGQAHSLALTKDGDVFAWGRGHEGQLGVNKLVEVLPTPKYVPAFQGKQITRIACGQRHSLALDSLGQVYSWGEGRCGQLGRGKQRECRTPSLVEFPTAIVGTDIVAGAGHSGVLTDEGRLFVWGLNNYGQLGLGDLETRWFPEVIAKDKFPRVLKVVFAAYAGYCIDKKKRVHAWGKGYIGLGGSSCIQAPTLLERNTENRQFAELFASDYSLLCFSPLRVYSMSPCCGPRRETNRSFLRVASPIPGDRSRVP